MKGNLNKYSCLVLWERSENKIKSKQVLEIQGSSISICLNTRFFGLILTEEDHLWSFDSSIQSILNPLFLPKAVSSISVCESASLIISEGRIYSLGKDPLRMGVLGIKNVYETNYPLLIENIQGCLSACITQRNAVVLTQEKAIFTWGNKHCKPKFYTENPSLKDRICLLNGIICVLTEDCIIFYKLNRSKCTIKRKVSMNVKDITYSSEFICVMDDEVHMIDNLCLVKTLWKKKEDTIDRIAVFDQMAYATANCEQLLYEWEFPKFNTKIYEINQSVQNVLASKAGCCGSSILEKYEDTIAQLIWSPRAENVLLLSKIISSILKKNILCSFEKIKNYASCKILLSSTSYLGIRFNILNKLYQKDKAKLFRKFFARLKMVKKLAIFEEIAQDIMRLFFKKMMNYKKYKRSQEGFNILFKLFLQHQSQSLKIIRRASTTKRYSDSKKINIFADSLKTIYVKTKMFAFKSIHSVSVINNENMKLSRFGKLLTSLQKRNTQLIYNKFFLSLKAKSYPEVFNKIDNKIPRLNKTSLKKIKANLLSSVERLKKGKKPLLKNWAPIPSLNQIPKLNTKDIPKLPRSPRCIEKDSSRQKAGTKPPWIPTNICPEFLPQKSRSNSNLTRKNYTNHLRQKSAKRIADKDKVRDILRRGYSPVENLSKLMQVPLKHRLGLSVLVKQITKMLAFNLSPLFY